MELLHKEVTDYIFTDFYEVYSEICFGYKENYRIVNLNPS
jgi:hypothetical protein